MSAVCDGLPAADAAPSVNTPTVTTLPRRVRGQSQAVAGVRGLELAGRFILLYLPPFLGQSRFSACHPDRWYPVVAAVGFTRSPPPEALILSLI